MSALFLCHGQNIGRSGQAYACCRGCLILRQPSGTNHVRKKQEHIAVLAGGQQISEMIVLLMYRKLKNLLDAESLQSQLQTPERKNKD